MKTKKIKRVVMVPVCFYIEADSEESFSEAVSKARKTWHSSMSCGGPGRHYNLDSEQYFLDNPHRKSKGGWVDYVLPDEQT